MEVFRRFLEAAVERCTAAGLVWGKEMFIDSAGVEADASTDSPPPSADRRRLPVGIRAAIVGSKAEHPPFGPFECLENGRPSDGENISGPHFQMTISGHGSCCHWEPRLSLRRYAPLPDAGICSE